MTSKEALEILVYGLQNNTYQKEDLDITISRAKEIIKEDLEALEIIKAKKVNIWAVNFHKNYIKYNEFRDGDDRKLTEKEFNLIKEKLAND